MKSTGEVMGIDTDFGLSFQKAQLGAGVRLPEEGTVFLSVNDRDKEALIPIAQQLSELDFRLVATRGTEAFLQKNGIDCELILKIQEGRPNIVDAIKNGEISLMINTPAGEQSQAVDPEIRQAAVHYGLPYTTTLAGAAAAVAGIQSLKRNNTIRIRSLQDFHSQ
jgi:carbamoyl-phosphate synthase large subunit